MVSLSVVLCPVVNAFSLLYHFFTSACVELLCRRYFCSKMVARNVSCLHVSYSVVRLTLTSFSLLRFAGSRILESASRRAFAAADGRRCSR